MQINPYLSFNGNCADAFKFYEQVLGGTGLVMMPFSDSPMAAEMPGLEKAILHAQMTVAGIQLMGSDAPHAQYEKPQGTWVSISLTDPEEADQIYSALSENGVEVMPVSETFWAHRFGMVIDQYGTPWMVNCYKGLAG